MSNTFETAVTPEQAAELVRQISLLAETFEKKKRAIIRGIRCNTSSYDELKTIEYAIENVTNISNRARNLIRKQNNRDKALQDNREKMQLLPGNRKQIGNGNLVRSKYGYVFLFNKLPLCNEYADEQKTGNQKTEMRLINYLLPYAGIPCTLPGHHPARKSAFHR